LDWEKLFDRIDRIFLWRKLLNANVSTNMVNALKAMYSQAKATVNCRNTKSTPIISKVGIKQGDPASSILCLFFLNDLLENINSSINGIFSIDDLKLFMLLFADDAAVFANDPVSLKFMLNDNELYCNKWALKLNVNKTKVMIF